VAAASLPPYFASLGLAQSAGEASRVALREPRHSPSSTYRPPAFFRTRQAIAI